MNIITAHRSPNFEPRRNGATPRLAILHYTGMKDGASALARLIDPTSKVSAHYLVEEDGRIFSLVDESQRAWHAGASFWAGERDINSHSIGIEIVNPGHECGYRSFPVVQMQVVRDLCAQIKERYHLSAAAFLGHSDVAPQRKEDPGELFDWPYLAEMGIGLWPKNISSVAADMSVLAAQEHLATIGYECSQNGIWDEIARATLIAFQRHYRPRDFSGILDKETWAILSAVARLSREAAKQAA